MVQTLEPIRNEPQHVVQQYLTPTPSKLLFTSPRKINERLYFTPNYSRRYAVVAVYRKSCANYNFYHTSEARSPRGEIALTMLLLWELARF